MAARINRQHDARTRQRIQAAHLIRRLQAFALGQDDPQSKRPIMMTQKQVAVALGRLNRTLPNLAGIGTPAGPAVWMEQHTADGQGGDVLDTPPR